MPTESSIPYPEANELKDILTEDQKKALNRLSFQGMITHFEAGKPANIPDDVWPKILKVNLPKLAEAINLGLMLPEWAARGQALIDAHPEAFVEDAPAPGPTPG